MNEQIGTAGAGEKVRLDPERFPQSVRLQIGAIFLRAFERDRDTPEFQESFRQWKQEREGKNP